MGKAEWLAVLTKKHKQSVLLGEESCVTRQTATFATSCQNLKLIELLGKLGA